METFLQTLPRHITGNNEYFFYSGLSFVCSELLSVFQGGTEEPVNDVMFTGFSLFLKTRR